MLHLSFCLIYIWMKSHFTEYCHFAAIPAYRVIILFFFLSRHASLLLLLLLFLMNKICIILAVGHFCSWTTNVSQDLPRSAGVNEQPSGCLSHRVSAASGRNQTGLKDVWLLIESQHKWETETSLTKTEETNQLSESLENCLINAIHHRHYHNVS